MIPLAMTVGLALLGQTNIEVAHVLDRASCAPRPKISPSDVNSSTAEGLLRLDLPRLRECLPERRLLGEVNGLWHDEPAQAVVRVRGGARTRYELSGDLNAPARACLRKELETLYTGLTLPDSIDVQVSLERGTAVGTPLRADCSSPGPREQRTCGTERIAIRLADKLRLLATERCECLARVAVIPAEVTVEVDMRAKPRPAFVVPKRDDPATSRASECLSQAIDESRLLEEAASLNLTMHFTVLDSAAASRSKGAPEFAQMQTTAIVERRQGEVLLASGLRQRAFERLDAKIDLYDRNLAQAKTDDAPAMERVKQNAAELEPIHADCLALVKADDELTASLSALIDDLGEGLALSHTVGVNGDDWKRELDNQTSFRTAVGQERSRHSAECEEIARAAQDGLVLARTAALATPRKPSAQELFRKLSRDIQRRGVQKLDASGVDSRGVVDKR